MLLRGCQAVQHPRLPGVIELWCCCTNIDTDKHVAQKLLTSFAGLKHDLHGPLCSNAK